ncbi:hypothetical protein JX265_011960 [Neoarthrinium moseri]|uniref:Chitin-binding type-1 domain-containing protein n=1 Tax=Neoarthrinium moseri TaxID=1658444 RepID=A0A9P9WBQ5_9PEZI|nr:uncharacterized protein JN550_008943 [Neoarthrinium moseri]KAI1846358.1 hypothetical protein JX266_007563 [Neoarthrinium moseri]KAI1856063.1 hypothetical protein JX265_011960 [Neoarthrinium moseri]KAI1864386.1 hypothetical protein JN550_008943 [Neoarthrinium moseri]
MFSLTSQIVVLLLAASAWTATTPDGTCGLLKGGANKGYTCLNDKPCCSSSGYCGTTDDYCLSSYGCQGPYSNATASCYAPKNGTTISPDGTCGLVSAGKYGYKCPATGSTCCSVAGYCGNTTAHCTAANGCQAAYGKCT